MFLHKIGNLLELIELALDHEGWRPKMITQSRWQAERLLLNVDVEKPGNRYVAGKLRAFLADCDKAVMPPKDQNLTAVEWLERARRRLYGAMSTGEPR